MSSSAATAVSANDVLPEYRDCEKRPIVRVLSVNGVTYGSLFSAVLEHFTDRTVLLEWNGALAFAYLKRITQPFSAIKYIEDDPNSGETVTTTRNFVRVMRVELHILSVVPMEKLRENGYPTQRDSDRSFKLSPGTELVVKESCRYTTRDSRLLSLFSLVHAVHGVHGSLDNNNNNNKKVFFMYGDGRKLCEILSNFRKRRVVERAHTVPPSSSLMMRRRMKQEEVVAVSKTVRIDFTRPSRFHKIKVLSSGGGGGGRGGRGGRRRGSGRLPLLHRTTSSVF